MDAPQISNPPGLYLCLISVHGLIRGHALELGRDADTGGQILYVVELARALAAQPGVARVDLLTRLVDDPGVAADYAAAEEPLSEGARIVRITAGPAQYLPKEMLWDHLDTFADNAIAYLREQPRMPDLVHSHYADAGHVGSRLAHTLGLPLIHTGHSLGRVKWRRLIASGLSREEIEQRYNMARRIEAEEMTLATAERVITSTHQEIEEQYGLYDYYQPKQMSVIPPGTDLSRFHPPDDSDELAPIQHELARFLEDPDKPAILALSRPDARKNIAGLVCAYGQATDLQQAANLVIIAGNRDDIGDLDIGAQEVLTEILVLIDRYDLYGKVAYPKHHSSDDVPRYYRLVAAGGGVFVNPALTEPFGLTLIEAAASGLPIVATEDGGPRDIIGNCHNGVLIDPLDPLDIARGLREVLLDREHWPARAAAGIDGVRQHYAWQAHAASYLAMVQPIIAASERTHEAIRPARQRSPYHERAIFTDIDQNLLGDPHALAELIEVLRANRKCAVFGIATGRRLDSALKVLKENGVPEPDLLITSGGTAIHYAPKLNEDLAWSRHLQSNWTPQVVREVLAPLPGLLLQPKSEQSRYKISYYIDPDKAPTLEEIYHLLHKEDQAVNVNLAFGQFLDVMPQRASKGLALRYVATRWNIPLEHILVAGGSGADEDMMRGNTLAAVVANRHNEELSGLSDIERIYFAKRSHAGGILEALDYYDFFGSCNVPHTEGVQ